MAACTALASNKLTGHATISTKTLGKSAAALRPLESNTYYRARVFPGSAPDEGAADARIVGEALRRPYPLHATVPPGRRHPLSSPPYYLIPGTWKLAMHTALN